jgi:hypothetical protein
VGPENGTLSRALYGPFSFTAAVVFNNLERRRTSGIEYDAAVTDKFSIYYSATL